MTQHILLVEDDTGLRDFWSSALSREGYAVRSAEDAQAAIELARIEPRPRLAILDLGLPPQPQDPSVGLGLLEQLISENPRVKALVLTGQDEPAISWRAISLGAFDYLVKPATKQQVLQALKRAELFLYAEQSEAEQGQARIVVSAPIAQGVREFGDAAQERLVRAVMDDCQHNVAQAARQLGLSREHLYYFLRKFGVERQAP